MLEKGEHDPSGFCFEFDLNCDWLLSGSRYCSYETGCPFAGLGFTGYHLEATCLPK